MMRSLCGVSLVAWLLAVLIPCFAGLASAAPANKAEPQLWAKLQGNFDSTKVKVGDSVSARVTYDWYAPDCTVAADTFIVGKVMDVVQPSGNSNRSEVSILFAVGCMGGRKVPLNLVAVLYAIDDGKSQMDMYNAMPSGQQLGGPGGSNRVIDMGALPSPGIAPEAPGPVKVGQVTGMRHLVLGPVRGAGKSAELSTTDKSLRIAKGTRLVFQMGTPTN
jgi:hypothetical protein